MKQVFQNIKNGQIVIDEVPIPSIEEKSVLIKTEKSLISAGTEKSLIEFGKSNYIQKAQKRPDQIKKNI